MAASNQFLQAIDDARLVRLYHTDGGAPIVACWFGGSTVNFYDVNGNCVDCFTLETVPELLSDVSDVVQSMNTQVEINWPDHE